MLSQETFSSFQICKGLKINRPTLQDWLSRGFIKPEIQAKGRGTKNAFSEDNLYQIELFRQLTVRGFSRIESSRWVRYLSLSSSVPLVDRENPFYFMVVRCGSKLVRRLVTGNEIRLGLFMQKEKFGTEDIEEIHLINLCSIMKKINDVFS
jgi:hypothetical protein